VIDINVHGQSAYPIADKLMQQRIPFIFATGYSREALPSRSISFVNWTKRRHRAFPIFQVTRAARLRQRGHRLARADHPMVVAPLTDVRRRTARTVAAVVASANEASAVECLRPAGRRPP